MNARDAILQRIRSGVRRSPGQPAAPPPPVLLRVAPSTHAEKLSLFRTRLEALAGRVEVVPTREDARALVASLLSGKTAVATDEPYLADCGIAGLDGVVCGVRDPASWRSHCAERDIGITSARWALAATGTLVMVFDSEAPRLASLLPPLHIAVVPASRLLHDTQEWVTRELPDLDRTSSTVLITGPSRTADIEQILVRGVHGPKELLVILVEDTNA